MKSNFHERHCSSCFKRKSKVENVMDFCLIISVSVLCDITGCVHAGASNTEK